MNVYGFITSFIKMWSVFQPKYDNTFRTTKPIEQRLSEALRVKGKFPNYSLVVIEPDLSLDLQKKKFLVNPEMTLGELLGVIRSRTNKLHPSQALFVYYLDNTLPPISMLVSDMYKLGKNPDGFLYLRLCPENVYG